MLGIFAGARWFFRARRAAGHGGALAGPNYAVAIGCMLGAAVGNRLVAWLQQPEMAARLWSDPWLWMSGQSMVGGLLGGLIGVEVAKSLRGQRQSTGDHFVAPVLLGLAIGRVGCFIAGRYDDTAGVPTQAWTGVDFGDGLPRHPTQLYEIVFVLLLWTLLARARNSLSTRPGLQFKLMLCAYLAWRLCIDFLKPVPHAYILGLSGIQFTCALALALYAPLAWRQRHSPPHA